MCGSWEGQIKVDSQSGIGSRFEIELPEQSEIQPAQSTERVARGIESIRVESQLPTAILKTEKVLSQGRLLVVDDNEMNCEVLKDLLEQEGFSVQTAPHGQEALRIMRREHPDLLLLDMMMPYFSGEDVIKAMQADNLLQDIPVILITARASEDDRLFGLSLGADDYLAKPIHHEELLFRVRNILHRLDARQKQVVAEEGQKMAQLGRLMQEYSHELKNVFQMDAFRSEEIPQACEKILARIPFQSPNWSVAARKISHEQYLPAESVRLSNLSVDNINQSQKKILRSLRGHPLSDRFGTPEPCGDLAGYPEIVAIRARGNGSNPLYRPKLPGYAASNCLCQRTRQKRSGLFQTKRRFDRGIDSGGLRKC